MNKARICKIAARKSRIYGVPALLLSLLLCLVLSGCEMDLGANGGGVENPFVSDGGAFGNGGAADNGGVSDNGGGESLEILFERAGGAHDLSSVPPFSGSPYAPVNGNYPGFTEEDFITISFETYSDLDSLGRCGAAYANIGTDLMPTEARGNIGQVKPSGWNSAKYDSVDGKYLYNRCHLIGYQLTAENANRQNLITGTRYLNVKGMLPFENLTADYIKETGNHVLYRVTPVFDGDNLVASGVQMEAVSVEDGGEGVLFNVYCYNVQPGIVIDYATGESREASDAEEAAAYVLNTNTHKFHVPSCSVAARMGENARQEYTGSREALIAEGYEPCQRCNP